jgi:alpha-beta hydrolase superfamily lysophospholipase
MTSIVGREHGYVTRLATAVAALQQLAVVVRGGQYTGAIGRPTKLVLVGFSFGSYITHSTIASTPDITNAAVLTAIGLNITTGVNAKGLARSFISRIASLQNPQRFGALDTRYLTWADQFAALEK